MVMDHVSGGTYEQPVLANLASTAAVVHDTNVVLCAANLSCTIRDPVKSCLQPAPCFACSNGLL
jgi:hypothetical protein